MLMTFWNNTSVYCLRIQHNKRVPHRLTHPGGHYEQTPIIHLRYEAMAATLLIGPMKSLCLSKLVYLTCDLESMCHVTKPGNVPVLAFAWPTSHTVGIAPGECGPKQVGTGQ